MGHVPRLVAADAGFYSAKNVGGCEATGVKRVCILNRSTKSLERKREQRKRWFRNGKMAHWIRGAHRRRQAGSRSRSSASRSFMIFQIRWAYIYPAFRLRITSIEGSNKLSSLPSLRGLPRNIRTLVCVIICLTRERTRRVPHEGHAASAASTRGQALQLGNLSAWDNKLKYRSARPRGQADQPA